MVLENVSAQPSGSVMVNIVLKFPAVAKVCDGDVVVESVPSPKVHKCFSAGSLALESLKYTVPPPHKVDGIAANFALSIPDTLIYLVTVESQPVPETAPMVIVSLYMLSELLKVDGVNINSPMPFEDGFISCVSFDDAPARV